MGRRMQCDDIYYYIIRQVIPVGLTPVATTMDTGTEDSEKIKSVSGRARSNLIVVSTTKSLKKTTYIIVNNVTV